jgi:hypothetical protein
MNEKEIREQIADEIKALIKKEEDKNIETDDFIAGMEWVEHMVRTKYE